MTPWAAARQNSLFFTLSQNLLKRMSIESVMPSNHLIPCHPLLLLPSIFPASGSFTMSCIFPWGGQSIGASVSASVLPRNIQGWFPLELTGWISLQSKGLPRLLQHHNSKASIFGAQPSCGPTLTSVHDEWKNHSLIIWTLSAKWCLCFLICCDLYLEDSRVDASTTLDGW